MTLDKNILQSAYENAMFEVDSVHNEIMATLREKVEKKHPYTLTPPTTEKGRWQTSYIDGSGKRKNLKAPTKEQLLDKLIPIYFSKSHIDNLSFHELFDEWLAYKSSVTNSPNTIKRHTQHYNKYFASSVLDNMKVTEIDELLLEQECNRIIREFNLTRKEWCNAKTILNGMYGFAIRKKYLTENPLANVQILVQFKQVVKKTGKTETYNTEELASINAFLDRLYAETSDTSYLAVKLNFLLGLRVGELVALKWEDWCDKNHLHIVREEIRDQTDNSYSVVEHTKTNRDRFVVVIPKAIEIFNKIERTDELMVLRLHLSCLRRSYGAYETILRVQRYNLHISAIWWQYG